MIKSKPAALPSCCVSTHSLIERETKDKEKRTSKNIGGTHSSPTALTVYTHLASCPCQRGAQPRSDSLSEVYRAFIGTLSYLYRNFIGTLSYLYRNFIGTLSELYRNFIGTLSYPYRNFIGPLSEPSSEVYRKGIGRVSEIILG